MPCLPSECVRVCGLGRASLTQGDCSSPHVLAGPRLPALTHFSAPPPHPPHAPAPTGGPTVLLNTQGRDLTALFEAFHPFTDRPLNLLAKMKEVRALLNPQPTATSRGSSFPRPTEA